MTNYAVKKTVVLTASGVLAVKTDDDAYRIHDMLDVSSEVKSLYFYSENEADSINEALTIFDNGDYPAEYSDEEPLPEVFFFVATFDGKTDPTVIRIHPTGGGARSLVEDLQAEFPEMQFKTGRGERGEHETQSEWLVSHTEAACLLFNYKRMRTPPPIDGEVVFPLTEAQGRGPVRVLNYDLLHFREDRGWVNVRLAEFGHCKGLLVRFITDDGESSEFLDLKDGLARLVEDYAWEDVFGDLQESPLELKKYCESERFRPLMHWLLDPRPSLEDEFRAKAWLRPICCEDSPAWAIDVEWDTGGHTRLYKKIVSLEEGIDLLVKEGYFKDFENFEDK